MNGLEPMGKLLILFGLMLAGIGALIWLIGRLPGIGELPGTIRIERPGFTCIIPVLGSIILSLVLTIVLNIIARLLK